MPYASDRQRFKSATAATHYLAAMVDGEGSVTASIHPRTGNFRSRHISVYNTDLELIQACAEACEMLGLRYSISTQPSSNPKWKTRIALSIRDRVSIELFAQKVPIRSIRKREMLEAMVANYQRAAYARWKKILTPEVLREMYIKQGKSYREISMETGCPIASLAVRIRAAGIATRRHHNQYTSREVG